MKTSPSLSSSNPGCCTHILLGHAARHGLDIHVSTLPPVVRGRYTQPPLECPHGVTYWFEPTGEQIAEWKRIGAS